VVTTTSPAPPSAARRLWLALVCLVMAVPVGLDFWFIHSYAVNVPFADSWNGTLPSVRALVEGRLTFSLLWLPHNENRMLVPNLLQAVVDSHTRVNSVDDMYLSAILMTITLALLIWLAVRTTKVPLIWMVPIPFLYFSLVQAGNLLWAFQLAWMLILCCTLICLCALEASGASPGLFLVACLAAVVASFSSLQGLLLWPVGFVYAIGRGRSRLQLAVWAGLAVAVTAFYEWHIGNIYTVTSPTYALNHPVLAVRFFLQLMGNIVPDHHTAFALVLLAASALVLWGALRRQIPASRLRLPLALWLSGLLFDILVTIGRLKLDVPLSSRYTTYSLVFLIGVYLGVLTLLNPPARLRSLPKYLMARPWRSALTGLVLAAVLLQVIWSFPNGLEQGRATLASREEAALVLRDFRSEPNTMLAHFLYPPSGAYVRSWATWLQARHWSVFA
jgi:hypothetical protein